jgi:hypothetical protein
MDFRITSGSAAIEIARQSQKSPYLAQSGQPDGASSFLSRAHNMSRDPAEALAALKVRTVGEPIRRPPGDLFR